MSFLNDVEVGKRLESLRGKTSSRKIAIQAGIDPSQYKKIEKGELSITTNILQKLVSTFNWDGNFILYGHGTKVPRETGKTLLLEDIEDAILEKGIDILAYNRIILSTLAETLAHLKKIDPVQLKKDLISKAEAERGAIANELDEAP